MCRSRAALKELRATCSKSEWPLYKRLECKTYATPGFLSHCVNLRFVLCVRSLQQIYFLQGSFCIDTSWFCNTCWEHFVFYIYTHSIHVSITKSSQRRRCLRNILSSMCPAQASSWESVHTHTYHKHASSVFIYIINSFSFYHWWYARLLVERMQTGDS